MSLTATDDAGVSSNVTKDVSVTAGTGQPVKVTFVSISAEDGWIRESDENSNAGGRYNAGERSARAIRLGDDRNDRQYKSILSFDTSAIPDHATLVSAMLQITHGDTRGTNPFNTHSKAYLDIKTGTFGDNASLQSSDFEAAADQVQVAVVTNYGESGSDLVVSLDAARITSTGVAA